MKYFFTVIILLTSIKLCFGDTIPSQKNDTISKKEAIVERGIKGKESFDWNNVLSAILGGLIGLSPSIISGIRKSRIRGKIISNYANFASLPQVGNQTVYLQKISIFSANKDFFLKDIEVKIKYPNSQELDTKVWTWRNLIFTFDTNGTPVQKTLNIDKQNYLLHCTVFPKNESIVGYISFSVDGNLDERFEYIQYSFVDFKGNNRLLIINQTEMTDNTQLFDDSIWI